MSNNTYNLSVGAVAQATGISVFRLRQWERRYGFPVAKKSASGHRRYSSNEIARLKLVVKCLSVGFRANKVVPLSYKELLGILQRQNEHDFLSSEAWLECVKNFEDQKLWELFESDWSRLGPLKFVDQRVGPFLVLLGECWQNKEVTVAQEHFFSELVDDFLSEKWRELHANNNDNYFLLASITNEQHGLGLQMCAVIAAHAKKRLIYLGGPTPTEDIIKTAVVNSVDSICLSFSTNYPKENAKKILKMIRKQVPSETKIMIGGGGAPKGVDNTTRYHNFNTFYEDIVK